MSSASSTLAVERKNSTATYIHLGISLFLMYGFGFLPTFSTVTPVGMKVLGVFLGVVYGYTFCDLNTISLAAMVAYGLTGYLPMGQALTSMFGNSTMFQSFVANFSAGALTYYGFGKWFVRWSLGLPLFKGRPKLYIWSFFVFFGFSAFFINQIPLLFLLFAIWTDIAENCGYGKDSSFIYVGFTGILISTTFGASLIPYKGWSLGLGQTWGELTGGYLNLAAMAVMTIIITAVTITIYMFAAQFVFKVDYNKLKAFDVNKMDEDSKTLRPRTKRIAIIYLTITVLAVIGSLFTKSTIGGFLNNTLTVSGLFAICVVLMLIIPSGERDGKACVVFNEVKGSAVSWPTMLMAATMIPLASAVTNEATGVLPMVTEVFASVFEGRSSLFLVAITVIVAGFLTNVGSNIAIGGALIPIIAPFAMQEGMNPGIVGMALLWIIKLGFVLPGASAPAAIMHSQQAAPNGKMRILTTSFSVVILMIVSIIVFAIGAPFAA